MDPYQPTGTYGGKVALEVRKWTSEGWRVQLLIPKHLRTGSKRFPNGGFLLVRGISFDGSDLPQKVTREMAYAICNAQRPASN